ncbi:MAG: hypothetical protein K2X93_16535 [Candidatus Obscuribacterales bacterium]|nr:hypothetical protein [Candidatus Obscuribacterales bacterium]
MFKSPKRPALCKDYADGKPFAIHAINEALGSSPAVKPEKLLNGGTNKPGAGEQVTKADLQQRALSPDQRARVTTETTSESNVIAMLTEAGMSKARAQKLAKI